MTLPRTLRIRYGHMADSTGEWMTQYTDTARSHGEAEAWLLGWRGQHGFRGGRVTPPSPSKPGWHLQVFTEDLGPGVLLPEGNRRVFVPRSQFKAMGIVL